MDKITEAIAHFVGLFEITLERPVSGKPMTNSRRPRRSRKKRQSLPVKRSTSTRIRLEDFVPSIAYWPVPQNWSDDTLVDFEFVFRHPEIPQPESSIQVSFLTPGSVLGLA